MRTPPPPPPPTPPLAPHLRTRTPSRTPARCGLGITGEWLALASAAGLQALVFLVLVLRLDWRVEVVRARDTAAAALAGMGEHGGGDSGGALEGGGGGAGGEERAPLLQKAGGAGGDEEAGAGAAPRPR